MAPNNQAASRPTSPLLSKLRASPPKGATRQSVEAWIQRNASGACEAAVQAPVKPGKGSIAEQVATVLVERKLKAEVRLKVAGPRIDRLVVRLKSAADVDELNRLGPRLQASLGLPVFVSPAGAALSVYVDVTRPSTTWRRYGLADLKKWVSAAKGALPMVPGVDPEGKAAVIDLAEAPHLLIGGTTGSGKSCLLHAVIAGLVLSGKPIRWVFLDPKRVELAVWRDMKATWLTASDDSDMVGALQKVVAEMERRYKKMEAEGVSKWTGPRVIVVVDELAELVDNAPEAMAALRTLARKARAAGIHLLLATQRPDAEVLDGQLRSNVPARIALGVQKGTESRIILDASGAEDLPRPGELLVRTGPELGRVHGLYLSPADLVKVAQGQP